MIPLLVGIGCPFPTGATESAAAESLPATIGGGDILSLGTGMVLVIGAILICAWIYSRTQALRGHTGNVFSIVASQSLGPKERILLVEVANKQLVIGMTATQVQTLHVFDEPIVDDASQGTPVKFTDRLKSALGATGK